MIDDIELEFGSDEETVPDKVIAVELKNQI